MLIKYRGKDAEVGGSQVREAFGLHLRPQVNICKMGRKKNFFFFFYLHASLRKLMPESRFMESVVKPWRERC